MVTALTIILIFIPIWFVIHELGAATALAAFDHPPEPGASESITAPSGPSVEHREAANRIRAVTQSARGMPGRERLRFIRNFMEELSLDREFNCRFIPVEADGVPAEWVVAPGVPASRRVMYIHGGAFMAGSPRSHRSITSRFSAVANAAVLAVDYRLMPEHRRMDGIEDCRSAYRWILNNGPEGPGPASKIYVSGDSAGGNLALMIAAWVRDQGLQAPAAVIALSPVTDAMHSSPSIRTNRVTDVMLGPLYSALMRIPRPLLLLYFWLQHRMLPSNPLVSPIFGDLAGLPPILIQASEAEMLLGDALRYVNKARASGTPARLQRWAGMMHVWQIFCPEVPEAREAIDRIGVFVNSV